jgi:succinoglycan biosynthesis transport protein ExoP
VSIESPMIALPGGKPRFTPGAGQPRRDRTLRDYFLSLRMRAPTGVLVALIVAAVAMVILMLQAPLYGARATIMLDPQQTSVLTPEQGIDIPSPDAAARLDSELEVLSSPALAEKVVVALKLEDEPTWNPALRPRTGLAAYLPTFGSDTVTAKEVPLEGSTVDPVVVKSVADAISVKRRGLSYVIDINVTSSSAAQSAAVANGLIDAYRQFGQQSHLDAAERASGWLADRVDKLRTDLEEAERAAQDYRIQSGLLTSGGVSLTEQQAAGLQESALAARADLAEKQARYQQVQDLIRTGGSPDTLAGALNSETIRDLRQREADLLRRQAELENRLGDRHPSIQNGRAEIQNAREQIRAEVERIQTSLKNELDVAQARVRALDNGLQSVRGTLVDNNVALVRLNELERNATVARNVYENFLARQHEVEDQDRLQSDDARVVALARTAEQPVFPNPIYSALISIAVGLVIGAMVVVFLEWNDQGLRNGDELERMIGAPALASMPIVKPSQLRLLPESERHPAGYAVEKPLSRYAESFRVVRTAIATAIPSKTCTIIAVTSALPGDGKTTTSLSLARVAALSGQRVLLVDCDLRRRSLNSLLRIKPTKGLIEVLSGEVVWKDVVGRDEPSGANVLPLAEGDVTPRDVFGSPAMKQFLDDVRGQHDLIILDCPPVLAVADSRVLAQLADGTLIVARAGNSHMAVSAVLDQLEAANAHVIGILLNAVNAAMAGSSSYKEALYYRYAQKAYYVE